MSRPVQWFQPVLSAQKPYLSLLWHPPQPSGSPSKVISRPRRPCGALARQGAAVATPAASSGHWVSLNCVCTAYWCVLVRTGALLVVFGCYFSISRDCIAVFIAVLGVIEAVLRRF